MYKYIEDNESYKEICSLYLNEVVESLEVIYKQVDYRSLNTRKFKYDTVDEEGIVDMDYLLIIYEMDEARILRELVIDFLIDTGRFLGFDDPCSNKYSISLGYGDLFRLNVMIIVKVGYMGYKIAHYDYGDYYVMHEPIDLKKMQSDFNRLVIKKNKKKALRLKFIDMKNYYYFIDEDVPSFLIIKECIDDLSI